MWKKLKIDIFKKKNPIYFIQLKIRTSLCDIEQNECVFEEKNEWNKEKVTLEMP